MMPISKDANEAKTDHTIRSYKASDSKVEARTNKNGITVCVLIIGKKEISPLREYRAL